MPGLLTAYLLSLFKRDWLKPKSIGIPSSDLWKHEAAMKQQGTDLAGRHVVVIPAFLLTEFFLRKTVEGAKHSYCDKAIDKQTCWQLAVTDR